MRADRMIGELPSYSLLATGVIARRNLQILCEIGHGLIKHGYTVKTEWHCGFWLLHWEFPKPRHS